VVNHSLCSRNTLSSMLDLGGFWGRRGVRVYPWP